MDTHLWWMAFFEIICVGLFSISITISYVVRVFLISAFISFYVCFMYRSLLSHVNVLYL